MRIRQLLKRILKKTQKPIEQVCVQKRIDLMKQWLQLAETGRTNMTYEEYERINTQLHGWELR